MFRKILAFITLLLIPVTALGIYFWFFYSRDISLDYRGTTRSYRLHIPVGYTKGSSLPLVIMLHGYGDHPRVAEVYTQFSSLSDTRKFLVVYPYGTGGPEDSNLSWNAGFCCALAMRDRVDDVGFINFLTDELIRNYSIDPNRIYLAGYSNGAMLAYRIAMKNPEKYAAVAVVAGTVAGASYPDRIYSQFESPDRPVSLITFHGTKDLVVPFLGGENVFRNQSGLAEFASFNHSVEFVSQSNGCRAPVITAPFTGVTLRTYTDCLGGAEIAAYSLSDRGHIWPGGLFESSIYGRTLGISASSAIWDFFLRHSLK